MVVFGLITTILCAVIFTAYLIYSVCIAQRIPGSVSETFYIIPWGRLLTIVYVAMAFLLLPPLLEVTPSAWQFLCFLFPFSIAMVGGFADYAAGNHILVPHMIFTWIAIICSALWSVFATPYWYVLAGLLAIFFAVAFITKTQKTCMSWWLEIALFWAVFVELALMLLI